jgi:hypothetical protein
MVALIGPGWVLAPSLIAYVHEADAAYPQRDRTSDGSIGDLAHAARDSDHNPYEGFVHAVDLDENLAPGLDLKGFAEQLRIRRDPRIRYVIYEGRIFKGYVDSAGHAPWSWYPYTGTNAHASHLHLSINRTTAARDDVRPWGFKVAPAPITPPDEEDDDMPRFEFVHVSNGKTYVIGPGAEPKIDDLTTDEIAAVRKAGWEVKSLPLSVWNKAT